MQRVAQRGFYELLTRIGASSETSTDDIHQNAQENPYLYNGKPNHIGI
jgi:hypothetical protein